MPEKRSLEQILNEDANFRRFIEINLEILSNLARIGHGEIQRVVLKDGKLLVKYQSIIIDGSEK